jgi:hypothetical protein
MWMAGVTDAHPSWSAQMKTWLAICLLAVLSSSGVQAEDTNTGDSRRHAIDGDPLAQLVLIWTHEVGAKEGNHWLAELAGLGAMSAIENHAGILVVDPTADAGMVMMEVKKALAAGSTWALETLVFADHSGGVILPGDVARARLADAAWRGDRAAQLLLCRFAVRPNSFNAPDVGWCRREAEAGGAEGNFRLAMASHGRPDDFIGGLEASIREGLGITPSATIALPHYRKAAQSGHADAQARLAALTASGKVISRNDVEAAQLAKASASQGSAEGKGVLGLLMLQGRGMHADQARAVRLIRDSAEAGNRLAQYTMASLHFRGRGVQRDFTSAVMWLELASLSSRGDPPPDEVDGVALEPMARTRKVAASVTTPAMHLDALERAVALRKRLAAEGKWPLVEPVPTVARP